MIFTEITDELYLQYKRSEFTGTVFKLDIDPINTPIEEWREDNFQMLTWDFEQLDSLVRSLFEVRDFFNESEHDSPEPAFEYDCIGGDKWEIYKDNYFTFSFQKNMTTMVCRDVPFLLLAKFFQLYDTSFPKDQPLVATNEGSASPIYMRKDLTTEEFFAAIVEAD
ncbi:hypothetical protein SAMN05444141_101917 [Pseudovibrio denitrificans]|uniref:Uncharacterized protein n=1 Tax=Pseudovibrio denitrificans TaxID=258256 RepID=A0A1I6YJ69_9HYPH|nr:hypothetical protein [Pseudovibrio denitrificans]SFT50566.1 hypothetical protein SAMN05444141_101917 [Pseudovibrio denitrificans]